MDVDGRETYVSWLREMWRARRKKTQLGLMRSAVWWRGIRVLNTEHLSVFNLIKKESLKVSEQIVA